MYPRNGTAGVPNGTRSPDEWQAALADVARRLRRSTPVLSERESQRLHDVQKGRFGLETLRLMLGIAGRASDPADGEALLDLCRAEMARAARPARTCTTEELFVAEEDANHALNVAQLEYRRGDRSSRARLIEAARRQQVVTEQLIEHSLVG